MSSAGRPGEPSPTEELRPVAVPMTRIVEIGIAVWAVALVVCLVVPTLREGSRSWWPWCCGTGMVLGLIGLAYLRRGRGNAAEANDPDPGNFSDMSG